MPGNIYVTRWRGTMITLHSTIAFVFDGIFGNNFVNSIFIERIN